MTGLSILALLAGLACIPVLDPDSRFWLRARWRARRVKQLRAAQPPVADSLMVAEAEMLRAGLKSARKSWEENIRGGWLALADSDRETIDEISERLRKALLAPRPRRISPPGPSPIPRKPGCYSANRSVNPATVRPPPSSPSAVIPARPFLVNEAKARRPNPNRTRPATRRM